MDSSSSKRPQAGFRKDIGLFGGVSILGGIMIGGGIFYLGSYVLERTGFSLGLSLLCWIIGGIVSLMGGLCFAELGAMDSSAGGMTVYLNRAYHPIAGFLNGFKDFTIGGPGSIAAGALALAAMFGLDDTLSRLAASAVIVAFTAYNLFGVKLGSRLQNVAMVAKLVPIVIIIGAALIFGKAAPELSLASHAASGVSFGKTVSMIAFASIATLWAYEGWTNLNTVAEEMKNPKRNLPLSLIIAIAGITVIYVLFNYAIFRALPKEEMQSLIEGGELYLGTVTATRLLGTAGGIIVSAGMIVSMLGSINGMTLTFPRTYYAMAEEGHFFPSFKRLSGSYGVPSASIIWQGIISVGLVWLRSLDELTSLVVFSSMFFNTLAILAVLVMRKKAPDAPRPYRVWGGALTVVVTLIINVALMANTLAEDAVSCALGLIVMAVGVPVYIYFDRKLKMKKAA